MLKRPHSTNDSYELRQFSWFVKLRWSALAGLVLLVVGAYQLLELSLPLEKLALLLIFSAVTNVFLMYSAGFASLQRLIPSVLVFDVFLLTVFLYLTGGPSNPFSIIYLVHVCIASILASPRITWIIVVLSSLGFGMLFPFHEIIPELEMHHGHSHGFSLHLAGMLAAFFLVAILLGFFLSKMSETRLDQEREINDLKLIASQQEKLASLTTLAAGAAHELGSPLGAISIAVSELSRNLQQNKSSKALIEDTEFIASELKRCRSILHKMGAQAGELSGEIPSLISPLELKDLLHAELGTLSDSVELIADTSVHVYAPKKNLVEVLYSLIKNGIEASDGKAVQVNIVPGADMDEIRIRDFGSGMTEVVQNRLGEPFFTTKEPGKGMGLGVFLAKLFVKSVGGSFAVDSRAGYGTTVTLSIPRKII